MSNKVLKKDNSIGTKVLRGTLIIMLIGVLAKLAAFLSEAILAAYLGTTYQSDAYYMVSSIQQVLYPMLSVGIWKVFLPVYKHKYTKGFIAEADELTNQVNTFFVLCSIIVITVILLFAGALVSIVAPGFEGETRDLCIKLVRLSAPMYVFITASAVYASILQCHDKFFGSQIREVASHIPTILAAIFFYHRFGIEAMAVALVIGGVVRLIIELPFVDWGYKFRPSFHFGSSEFLNMIKRLPSALISEGVIQLNSLIDKAMASVLPEGTISGLNYGNRLMNVFTGLLSTAIATALYPQMIELIALDKKNELANLLVKIINIFCVITVPATIACILFRIELVAAVFQRGSFTKESTLLTSSIFALYSIGIFFIACNTVITNLFYGYGNTRTPMYISIANLVINVGLNIVLIHFWGVNGLALATSLSAVITFFVRLRCVEKYIQLNKKEMVITGTKVLFSSCVACIIPRIIFWIYPLNSILVLLVSMGIGSTLYLIIIKLLKVREINDVIVLLKARIRKKHNKEI